MIELEQLEGLREAEAKPFVEALSPEVQLALLAEFFDFEKAFARPSQRRPDGDWRVWALNAGRGFGKTRTGSENVNRWALEHPGCRMALIARTHSDLREVMIEHRRAGILATSPPWFRPRYEPSNRHIVWPSIDGAPNSIATTFTAEEPDDLRGPEVDFAWCDELASWKYLDETWANLKLALRGTEYPRTIITTTPRPLKFLRKLYADPYTVVTGGSTYENAANLPDAYLEEIERLYGGTSRGRQEIHAEILDEAEGALWKRKIIERYRVQPDEVPDLARVVVAIDPAVTATEQSDETGIIAAGSAPMNGRDHYYVLEDGSGRYSPLEWADMALSIFDTRMADRIVGEVNNGGDMIEQTLRTRRPDIPYRAVHASRGKYARAEPIAALYDQGLVHHVGNFDELEDQQCNWIANSTMRSPDRLDADVWAITELMSKPGGDEVTTLGIGAKRDRSSPWRMQ